MMQTAIDKYYLIHENPISVKDGKTEICGYDPSQPNPNPNPSLKLGLPSVGLEDPNREMHMLNRGGIRTRIICLTNAIEDNELCCDEKFDFLLGELKAEGREFGKLVKIVIPRPNRDHHGLTPGVGKAFFEYADLDGASRARSEMHRQYFGDHLVEAFYFPENKYAQGDFDA